MKFIESETPKRCNARIFVTCKEHIEEVKKIIKAIDYLEYEYLPDDLISVFIEDPNPVYCYKFNIDANKVMRRCWEEGIPVWFYWDSSDYYY